MPDFLAENNLCGQTILHLISRGNAVIAELLRLKDYVPKVFRLENKQDVQKYADIIFDFSYLKISDSQEQKIESNEVLRDLDEEFRDNHIDIIKRFYLVFESIHVYIMDLNHFLDEIDEGVYIQQTLESIFIDPEGKQLMCEALYLYGLMLLIVDAYVEGTIRERLLVSYYRYSPQRQDSQSDIDEVCKLLRDTGLHSSKRPVTYPEDYFKRIPIKLTYIDYVIGRLRSDDIYGQISVYPSPVHRSTALANQASMLYVCLYFSPNILHFQTAVMREIVDKYFPDNWVISIYMGYIVNLVETWDSFKAAKSALNNTLEMTNVRDRARDYGKNIPILLKSTNLLLKEGNITKETLLKDIVHLTNTLRSCNVILRWLMLHTFSGQMEKNRKLRQLREFIVSESKCERVTLFKLLLNTAQLELVTRDLYRQMLNQRESHWEELKDDSFKSLVELSEVFSGVKPLTRIQKNEKLQLWFVEISKEVQNLNQQESASSRILVQLIQALEEVQQFHQLESNMQVIQYLSDIKKNLGQMIRNLDIKEDVLINLQIIGDISYAWELIDSFTSIMQLGIKREPTLVIKLRAVFLKLASALEIPLLRINQAHSGDLVSVSQYYSKELEIYVRKVLQIIPNMMFQNLAKIIQMQTSVLKEIPARVEKDRVREYAQLEERFEFAELTHSISVFSKGMRMMKSTLVGVICLDPKKLLEDGIRKELVHHISKALHKEFIFSPKLKQDELMTKLQLLVHVMDGYKKSFEYIQDYINLNGLKIWQEEVTRIINYNVEQECNGFLRNKIQPWQSKYQNRYVPIPLYPPIDDCVNFIGRLAWEVVRLTDPRSSVYLDQTLTWYDMKTHKPILNKATIVLIASAIEIAGLVGLDRLFSFMIITALQKIINYLDNKNIKQITWVNITTSIHKDFNNLEESQNSIRTYQTLINRCTKIWPDFLEKVLLIGQLQLLRNLIAFHLNTACKFNANNLEGSLQALNRTLLLDITRDKYNPTKDLLFALSSYFDYAGMNEPFKKIYVTSNNNLNTSITLFLFVLAHLPRLFLPQNPGHLNRKKEDQIDGITFSIAVHSILKQFHSDINQQFIRYLSNYLLQITKGSNSAKPTELLPEVTLLFNFMENYTSYSEQSRCFYQKALSIELLHLQQILCNASI